MATQADFFKNLASALEAHAELMPEDQSGTVIL